MRYDPFAELDALQKQFFGGDTFTPISGLSLPTTDVYTNNDKELVVEAHLPHFEDKDVHVEIEKNVLVVRAERHEKQEDKDKKYVVRESSSSFYRRIHLPERANTDKIEADLENGVLKVTVPFKELPQPKKIAIASKSKK
jgi:HSP20 family protein